MREAILHWGCQNFKQHACGVCYLYIIIINLEGAVKRILKVKGAAASSAPPLPASLQKKPKPQQEQHKVPF